MTKDDYILKLQEDFGIPKAELVGKSEEELLLILQEKQKGRVAELAKMVHNKSFGDDEAKVIKNQSFDVKETWKRIIQNESNVFIVHAEFENLIHLFDGADIIMMIEKYAVNDEMYQKFFRLFRVKLRQYQEEILYEAEILCKKLPEEERFNFLTTLEENRDNIPHLKMVVEWLKNKKRSELLQRIAINKEFILKNYFPLEYEKEYKHFFEVRQLKSEFMGKILKNSSFYSSEELSRKSVDELREILEFVNAERAKQKKDRDAYKKFIKMIEEAPKKQDVNKELSSIVGMMMMELSSEQMKKIIDSTKELNFELGEMLDAALLRSLHEKSNRFKRSK